MCLILWDGLGGVNFGQGLCPSSSLYLYHAKGGSSNHVPSVYPSLVVRVHTCLYMLSRGSLCTS